MDYNTTNKKLILPEYGRNIQKMVNTIKAIPDKDTRNDAARAIINIMGNLNPHLRDIMDFRHKLWDHLFIMADFDLDIESPYPIPTRESLSERPLKVPYNQRHIKYKHFGQVVNDLIEKACTYPEGEEKEILILLIANYMKKSYLLWNKEVVNDETIYTAMMDISQGRLHADGAVKLTSSKEIIHRNKRKRIKK
jgi:hypothetical protein